MQPRWWPPLSRAAAAAAALASAALPFAVQGHFVASLQSNFVVNLDFEGDARSAAAAPDGEGEEADEAGEVKVMAFAGGRRKFRCRLPVGKNRTATSSRSGDVLKSRAHFISAKLATLRGICWKIKKDYWSYDVCFGRKVVQYRPDTDTRFSLGEHQPDADQLLPNGGVTELYSGGSDNRTTVIHYVCGSSEFRTRTFKLDEERPLHYLVIVSGPTFCAWKKEATETRDSDGNLLRVSALLEELRGQCVNVTQGWWTYEYCYPRSLTQYHIATSGSKRRDPEYILGTLNGTNAVVSVNQVNMSMVRMKPSMSPRERRAPPSNHWTLRQRLGGGNICDETGRPRAATMLFQCPPNWQSRPETRIVSINEASLCEYDAMIHTTLVCGHHKFVPTLPRGKETIQCVAQPKEL